MDVGLVPTSSLVFAYELAAVLGVWSVSKSDVLLVVASLAVLESELPMVCLLVAYESPVKHSPVVLHL